MGAGGGPNAALLAEAENTPRLASETIFRYARECNPREEPDALTRTSGSVRGAQGNLGPYRDGQFESQYPNSLLSRWSVGLSWVWRPLIWHSVDTISRT